MKMLKKSLRDFQHLSPG